MTFSGALFFYCIMKILGEPFISESISVGRNLLFSVGSI